MTSLGEPASPAKAATPGTEQQMERQLQMAQKQAEKKEALDEKRGFILNQILSAEARERLSRVSMVNGEKARQVEDALIRQAQTGQLVGKVSDDGMRQVLEQAASQERKATTKITIQRKKRIPGDDEDVEYDL